MFCEAGLSVGPRKDGAPRSAITSSMGLGQRRDLILSLSEE